MAILMGQKQGLGGKTRVRESGCYGFGCGGSMKG